MNPTPLMQALTLINEHQRTKEAKAEQAAKATDPNIDDVIEFMETGKSDKFFRGAVVKDNTLDKEGYATPAAHTATTKSHTAPEPTTPKWAKVEGELIAVKAHVINHNWPTPHSEDGLDVILAELLIMTGPHTGHFTPMAIIFPRVLFWQLSQNMGEVVVGRLAKGVARDGWMAPWTLETPSDEDDAVIDSTVWPSDEEPVYARGDE